MFFCIWVSSTDSWQTHAPQLQWCQRVLLWKKDYSCWTFWCLRSVTSSFFDDHHSTSVLRFCTNLNLWLVVEMCYAVQLEDVYVISTDLNFFSCCEPQRCLHCDFSRLFSGIRRPEDSFLLLSNRPRDKGWGKCYSKPCCPKCPQLLGWGRW